MEAAAHSPMMRWRHEATLRRSCLKPLSVLDKRIAMAFDVSKGTELLSAVDQQLTPNRWESTKMRGEREKERERERARERETERLMTKCTRAGHVVRWRLEAKDGSPQERD